MATPYHISSRDVVDILDRLGTCLVWLGSKQMYVWKLKYTIEHVEKARNELKCMMKTVEDTMTEAEHYGRKRKPLVDGWVKQGDKYVGFADSVVEEYKKRIDGEPTSFIVSVFLCPCEKVSNRFLNGEAIMRMNHILAHLQKGSEYATGAFEDVSFGRRMIMAAPAAASVSPETESPNTQPVLHQVPISSDMEHMRLSGFTEYLALARSESHESVAVVIRVKAPAYMLGSRAPVDLVLVLDASASMRLDGKLDQLKQGSMFVIHSLDAKDRLSVVTFGKQQRVLLPLTTMSDHGKRLANRKVQSLKAVGNRTIGPAMDLAYETLDERLDKDRVSNILLLTDGQDKRIFKESLIRYPDIYSPTYWRRSRYGYPTYTLGFGLDHDPRTLYYLAVGGCGTYSFVTENTSIRDAMALCIGGLTSIVAQKVKVSIDSAHQGVKISRVVSGGYDHHVEAGGKSGFINVMDLYASEEKNFIVYVNVPATDHSEAAATKLLTVNASYYCPLTRSDVGTEKLEISVERPRRVWGGRDDRKKNISVEIASEVTRARVFDGVKDIWLKSSQCTQYNLDFRFAGRDMSRQLDDLMASIDGTEEAEAAGERWDALRSNLNDMRSAISDIFDLIDLLRDSGIDVSTRVTGLPYMLSWLSSHQWQRAVTPGSVSKSKWFNFRTTRMHNMIESVDTAPSAYVGE